MIYNIPNQLPLNSGIYVISNSIDARIYIGSTINFWRRYSDHVHKLKKGTHANKHIQNFVNKYGRDKLSFDLLFVCKNTCLCFNEKLWIDLLKPKFNIKPIIERPYYEDEIQFNHEKLRQIIEKTDKFLQDSLIEEQKHHIQKQLIASA